MRIVYAGNQEVGCLGLEELLGLGKEVVLVLAHRKHKGEGMAYRSVKEIALRAGLQVFEYDLKNYLEMLDRMRRCEPDLLVSISWRYIFRRDILDIPKLGCINVHPSYLPKYRGANPPNWAMLNGERETGVTVHYIDEGIDTGDIIEQRKILIEEQDDIISLRRKQEALSVQLLREVLPLIAKGIAPRIPQRHQDASYFGRRRPEDGRIDWQRSAVQIHNLIRAVTRPYPGAFTYYDGNRVTIWKSAVVKKIESVPFSTGEIVEMGKGGQLLVGTGMGLLRVDELSAPNNLRFASGRGFI